MAKQILLVSTSAGEMGGRPTGLWLAELAEPYYVFTAAGFEVTVASPLGGSIPIDPGSMGDGVRVVAFFFFVGCFLKQFLKMHHIQRRANNNNRSMNRVLQ